MPAILPTSFIDTVAVSTREAEVPNASFGNGANLAGSNAHGIGINMEAGAIVGTPEQFTLLDQHGDARNAQISQHIGGPGISDPGTSSGQEGTLPDAVIRTGTNSDTGDGVVTPTGTAVLQTLGAGWVDTAI